MMKSLVVFISFCVLVLADYNSNNRLSSLLIRSAEAEKTDELKLDYSNAGNVASRKFPRYEEIESYIKKLAESHKDILSYFSIGKSSEGREILCVKLSTSRSRAGTWKRAILVDGGIHAREWIAVTTALYAIEQLVENPNNRHVLDEVDVYVIPLLNPDGYEYSHQDPSTRLWRGTRSNNTECKGADLNRNFEYQWMTTGGSRNPCQLTYAGKAPLSEPESQALAKFFQLYRGIIKVYVSLHSAGNYIFYPWGFTSAPPPNEPKLKCTASKAAEALSSTRPERPPYTVKEIGKSDYPASGMSMDYAIAKGGVDLAYTIELLDWRYGFEPPASEIEPVGKQFFGALKVFVAYVKGEVCNDLTN